MKTYLIVDGYNVIHYWAEGKGIEDIRLEEAREHLIHRLGSFSGLKGYETILVFDAYSQDDVTHEEYRSGIQIVFTGKNQTADSYIEKLVYRLPRPYTVKVVTSDYTLQRLVLANGGERISSRELLEEMAFTGKTVRKNYPQIAEKDRNRLNDKNRIEDYMDDEVLSAMRRMRKGTTED